MNAESKPTPGPWTHGGRTDTPMARNRVWHGDLPVASVLSFSSSPADFDPTAQANARRIVQCVNNFDTMLAALRDYMAAVAQMNAAMQDGINVHGAMSALVGAENNVRAAIAASGAKE